MKANKLAVSIAITLTALFITIGVVGFNGYDAFNLIKNGGLDAMSTMGKVLTIDALAVAVLSLVGIIFSILGAISASYEKPKRLFVFVAILQFLLVVSMGFYAGYYIYESLSAGFDMNIIRALVLVVGPYAFGAVALLVAFLKSVKSLKK